MRKYLMLVKTSFTIFNPTSVIIPGFSITSARPHFTSSEWLILPGFTQTHNMKRFISLRNNIP